MRMLGAKVLLKPSRRNQVMSVWPCSPRTHLLLSGPMQGSHSWHVNHTFKVWFRIMPQTENRQKDFGAHCMNI